MPAGVEGKEFTADTGYILSYENKKATYYTGSFNFSATKQLDGTTAYASGNTIPLRILQWKRYQQTLQTLPG